MSVFGRMVALLAVAAVGMAAKPTPVQKLEAEWAALRAERPDDVPRVLNLAERFAELHALDRADELVCHAAGVLTARGNHPAATYPLAATLVDSARLRDRPEQRVTALLAAAEQVKRWENNRLAIETFEEAYGLLCSLPDRGRLPQWLGQLRGGIIGLGQPERAAALLARLPADRSRDDAFAALSREAVDAGRPETARQLALAIGDPSRREAFLRTAGLTPPAGAPADHRPPPRAAFVAADYAKLSTVRKLLFDRDRDGAAALAACVVLPDQRARAWWLVARELRGSGDVAGARECRRRAVRALALVPPGDDRDQRLLKVLPRLAEDDWTFAACSAVNLSTPAGRARGLAVLAEHAPPADQTAYRAAAAAWSAGALNAQSAPPHPAEDR